MASTSFISSWNTPVQCTHHHGDTLLRRLRRVAPTRARAPPSWPVSPVDKHAARARLNDQTRQCPPRSNRIPR